MRFWIGVGIFGAVLIAAFVIFAIRLTEGPAPVPITAPTTAAITNIRISDTYDDGTHTIEGTATVPTACTKLDTTSAVNGTEDASSTPVIRIDLSAPLDTAICLQVLTDIDFSVSEEASSDALIEVYANGELASTTAPE